MLLALQPVPMILARHHGYWSNDTAMQIYKSIPTENLLTTKFFLKFEKRGIDDCWEWNGTITACGYGSLRYHHKGKSMIFLAHRVSFAIFKGRIKDGLVIDHLCNNIWESRNSCLSNCSFELCTNCSSLHYFADQNFKLR